MNYQDDQKQLSVTAEAMVGRQMQEVKGMVFMAKQFPRDENKALEKILKACERKTLADSAIYEYPRGGQKVSGPSIRLAEVVAQNWTNIDFGITELEQRNGESTVMAYAWDIENNTRQTKTFSQPHSRKAQGQVVRLTDPREIYELVANNGARRMRACILGIIPGDVIEAAVEKCREVMKNNLGPLDQKIQSMLKAFEEYKVTKEMLEEFIKCELKAFTAKDVVKLSGVFNSIKDGMSKPGDYFEALKAPEPKETGKTPLDLKLEAEAVKNGK